MGSYSSTTLPLLGRIYRKPFGIRWIERIKTTPLSYKANQVIVLVVTFLAYASYHATRKTTSIVKSVLDPESIGGRRPYGITKVGSGWFPFNTTDGESLLGELDLAFLGVYAVGMYFSGHIGDRMNLRVLLSVGMVGTGVFTSLFGVGYWSGVHSFFYFLAVQIFSGLFQSTGWPSVVSVVGNWFGKKRRGLIMGVWNSHTSVGNISGSLIASYLLQYGWGWSFVVPGALICSVGLLVLLLLPVSPASVGLERETCEGGTGGDIETVLKEGEERECEAVGFIEAWRIPGVAPFAFCLFFAKLVAYTFLYWLPFYISHTEIGGVYLSDETAGDLSTLFDVGGVAGGISAGYISDRLNARAITSACFMYCAIPTLYLYRAYGHTGLAANIALMVVAGAVVNGPYALITTAVSADLGTHPSLRGNSRALATVAAIIDGTGSVGAALGPLMTGYIISSNGWNAVFTALMFAALAAALLLTRLVLSEIREMRCRRRS